MSESRGFGGLVAVVDFGGLGGGWALYVVLAGIKPMDTTINIIQNALDEVLGIVNLVMIR